MTLTNRCGGKTVPRHAIVYLSHIHNKKLWRAYTKLQSECAAFADVHFALNLSSDIVIPDTKNVVPITPSHRAALGHLHRANSKGGDKAFLAFRQNIPEYDYYWMVEYDVAFSGDWSKLFNAFADNTSDLLCTNIHRRETNPKWAWWNSLEWPDNSKPELIRGFFAIARLSAKALDAIIVAGQKGFDGHYEIMWPTVLHHSGFSIEDIGGDGPFVRPANVNRWYTSTPTSEILSPGTLVYRPAHFRPGRTPDKLWHPVKHSFVEYVKGTRTYSRISSRITRVFGVS